MKYKYISEYYSLIENDNRLASTKVRTAYKNILDRLENDNSIYFDEKKAEHIIIFIENFCRASKGKFGGKKMELMLWQKSALAVVFGVMKKETDKRQFVRFVLYVGRKNGKSGLTSAIANYLLIADGERGAEIYSVATKKDQAKIVWNESVKMVKQSPILSERLKCTISSIRDEKYFGEHKYLGRDSNSHDGLNASGVLADEIHAWTDQNLYDVVYDSMANREQPLFIETSTAGMVRNSVFDNNYSYYKRIVESPKEYEDKTTFALLYELDNPNDWDNEEYWTQANPALDVLKSREFIRDKVATAKIKGEIKNIKTKDFNIPETAENTYLTFEQVNNNLTYTFEENKVDSVNKPKYAIGGVDLSKSNDLTCARILWKYSDNDTIYTMSKYFMVADKVNEREMVDKAPYSKWIEQGYITAIYDDVIHPKYITEWFVELMEQQKIYLFKVGYDAWSAKYWVDEMRNTFGDVTTPVHQGAKTLSLPIQNLKREFVGGRINYNNNPVDKWNFCNLTVVEDKNGNLSPNKNRNGDKIDGMATLLNCYVVYCDNKEVYESYMK